MIEPITQIKYNELQEKKVLSPLQYYKFRMSAKRVKTVLELLDQSKPYEKGIEPGQKSYVEKSRLAFIRTSCIAEEKFRPDFRKLIFLHPHRHDSIQLEIDNILLVKDGGIGESSIIDSTFLHESTGGFQYSSGIVKLNLKDTDPFFLLAILKSSIFKDQLHARVGLGTTITHASEEFLKCEIPLPRNTIEEELISLLSKAIIKKEEAMRKKWSQIVSLIDKEISSSASIDVFPNYQKIKEKLRLDVSAYSPEYNQYIKEISQYSEGYGSIAELGFKTKRGPSLQVRDAGRMVYSNRRLNDKFWVVIKPEDLSFEGSLDRFQFMGNSQKKWSFSKGDVLFSAEGTIGKFFVFCEDVSNFTTNIHSIMISNENIQESIVLGCILGYLRERGLLDKISVGAQGGSLALAYWDFLSVPKLKSNIKDELFHLYSNQPETKKTLNTVDVLKEHVNNSNDFGIFQLDTQIRYFKSILNQLVDCLAYDLQINASVISERVNNLTFMKSFEKFCF